MVGSSMAASEAEEIAKALTSLGIKKLSSGNGVDPALARALKQKNDGVTNSKKSTEATRQIETFFTHIADIQKKFAKVKSMASGEKYKKLADAQDIYDYINLALEVEGSTDENIKKFASGFNAHTASAAENATMVGILSPLHSIGVGLMDALRELDSSLKVRVFESEATKNLYDQYFTLEKQGFFEALQIISRLPKQLLTSVQVSNTLLTTIQDNMHITRQESVWVFNHFLELKGNDLYVDMENEYANLFCGSCGTLNRLGPDQLSDLQTNNKIPSCIVCHELLLGKCPKCKKMMMRGAKKHVCGWNVELKEKKDSFERAIQNSDLNEAQFFFEVLERLSSSPAECDTAQEKLDQLKRDNKTTKVEIEQLIREDNYDEAARKLKEAEEKYHNDQELQSLKHVINQALSNRQKSRIKAEIQQFIDDNNPEKAIIKLNEAESLGYDKELDIFRNRISQLRKIAQITTLTADINKYLSEGNIELAERTLIDAGKQGLETELNNLKNKIDNEKEKRKREERQALQEFGNGHFGNYSNAIKKITRILDFYPDFQQAKIWLKDNPRRDSIGNPRLLFKEGENQCTITWEDDDSFVTYTVRRAEGRYPRDPSDGVAVCNKIVNKKITDHLPADKPGVMWQYSIFAIRNLDGQWVKTDCPESAVWLPNPENIQLNIACNAKGYPIVEMHWDELSEGSIGVKVIRYSDEDDYSLSETIVDTSEKWSKAQTERTFVDDDVEHKTAYRYVFKQVWRRGTNKYMSSGVTRKINID